MLVCLEVHTIMKISARTIITNIVDSVIEEWQRKLPDKPLESYVNWRSDIVDRIEFQLNKHNVSLDELVVDTTEDKKISSASQDDTPNAI